VSAVSSVHGWGRTTTKAPARGCCSMRRTSSQDSREIQSMMEWCRSVDCLRDLWSISRCINVRSTSNHQVSISLDHACVRDAPARDCWWLLDATYKSQRFTRDPIDDGMVPLSWFLERDLLDIAMRQCSKHIESSSECLVGSCLCRWCSCSWLLMVARCDVQANEIHERSNRWWNGAAQLILGEGSDRYRDASMFEAHRIIEWVSRWIMLVSCSWLLMVARCDVQASEIPERSNRWWNGAAQLILGEVSDRYRDALMFKAHRIIEWVSRWIMLVSVIMVLVAADGCSMRRTS